MKVTLLLMLATLLALSCAQLQMYINNPKRVYSNPTDGTAILNVGAAMTTCSVTLVILDNSTDCVKFADQDGKVYNTNCTPEMSGSFELFTFASAAYLLNTRSQLVIFDMYTGSQIDYIGPNVTNAQNPYKIGLYTSYAVPTGSHTMVLADGQTNTTLWLPNWSIVSPGVNSYGSAFITQLNNTVPILCLFSPAAGMFMVVYENDTTVYTYSWTAATASPSQKLLNSFGGFGVIGACGSDFYNRVYLWDTGCNCLKVTNATGFILYQTELPEVSNPKKIQATRNKVFIWDDKGVQRYDLPPLSAVYSGLVNPTCSSTSVQINITGGATPYLARVLPDQRSSTTSNVIPAFQYNWTSNVNAIQPYNLVFTLYDDVIAPEFEAITSDGPSSIQTPASTVQPSSGQYSWGMLMANAYKYGIQANSVITGAKISATWFQTLEMMVYPTDQCSFRIDFTSGTTYYYFDYPSGSIPQNKWSKISIDLVMGPSASYSRFYFADLSNQTSTTSYLYVDNIRLLPYNSSARYMAVRDFCNVTIYSPLYPTNPDAVLAVNVDSKGTSCSAEDSTNGTDSDGKLMANVTGGIPPYTYSWSITNSSSQTVSNLPPISANLWIYQNSLNPSFSNSLSVGQYNLNDATYYSAPSGVSFVPSSNGTISFYAAGGISSDQYHSIEFWINAGNLGGQLLYASLIYQYTLTSTTLIHRLLGLPSIPPNVWIKVTFPVPSSIGTFNGLAITGVPNIDQAVVYLDDIRLLGTQNLTVTDSANCMVSSLYVNVLAPQPLSVTPAITQMMCHNSADGTASLSVSGGTAPYSYNWSNGQTAASLSGLSSGVYNVTVTDANECVSPDPIVINIMRPQALQIISAKQDAQCFGNTGSITAKVAGGMPPYTFSWASPSSSSFSVQPQPTPSYIFSDALQSPSTMSGYGSVVCGAGAHSGFCAIQVKAPSLPNLALDFWCNQCIDASKYSSIKFWISFLAPQSGALLSASLVSQAQTIYQTPLTLTMTTDWQEVIVDLPASGLLDSLNIYTNGTFPGDFLIDDVVLMSRNTYSSGAAIAAGFNGKINGLMGNYNLTVYDLNGCSVYAAVQINQPAALESTFAVTQPANRESTDGSVVANITGGVPPYSYYWPNFKSSDPDLNNIMAGTYILIVTDANGCTLNTSANIIPINGGATVRPYNTSVATGFGVIIGIAGILATISLIILGWKWSCFSRYGPFYCCIINIGVIISLFAAAVVLPNPNNQLCMAFPWLLGIAFNLVYGCLFIKTWALYRVFLQASKLKKTNLTPFYILKVLSVFVFVEVVYMLIWTFVSPPKAGYANLLDNKKEWQCTNDTPVFWIIFLSVKGLWLIVGAVLAFLTRNIADEYNESRSIGYAIYNDIVLILIAIPLALTLDQISRGVVIIEAAITVLAFTFTLLILFFPVWWQIFFSDIDVSMSMSVTLSGASTGSKNSKNSKDSPTNSGGGTSGTSREIYSL